MPEQNKAGFKKLFFGRRRSRPLKIDQALLKEHLLPLVTFQAVDIDSSNVNILEIGFGSGEHLVHKALQNASYFYFGIEAYENGVGNLLGYIDSCHLKNIRIFPHDVNLILEHFKSNVFDEVYLLFPDPWPKKRHAKRRFIQLETIEIMARILKLGGYWHIASDHKIYQQWVEAQFEKQSFFHQIRPDPTLRPTLDTWPQTRYEKKALRENRPGVFWTFKKTQFNK